MDNDDTAVSIQRVTKEFKIPHERVDSVKSLFTQPLRRRGISTQHALAGISFDIKKGEFFGIVGRNGSGKSTLLKIIAGIYQPTEGSVTVDGRLVPFIELGVGFNPELSGRENVYLNGALMGFSQKEIKSKYQSIVDFAEIEQFMDQKLKNYSSGMQVRLAFSVATILAESDILLIDEVLAVGDADFQRKCFDYFRKLKQEKKTVVFVSHDMGAVRDFCDRAVLIEGGKITVSGSVKEVAYAYAKLFGGEEAQKAHRRGSGEVKFEEVKSEKTIYGQDDKYLTFRIKYNTKKQVNNPVFGISIKNSAGTIMVGTNTNIKGKKIKFLPRMQKGEIVWKVQNILNDGNYSLEVTCIGKDGKEYDWWEDSLVFSVSRLNHTPFAVEPPISFSMDIIG